MEGSQSSDPVAAEGTGSDSLLGPVQLGWRDDAGSHQRRPRTNPRSTSLSQSHRPSATFTLDMPRALAERLSVRAIQEGRNVEAVIMDSEGCGHVVANEGACHDWPRPHYTNALHGDPVLSAGVRHIGL